MTVLICDSFHWENESAFCSPTVPWTGIGRGLWWERRDQVP